MRNGIFYEKDFEIHPEFKEDYEPLVIDEMRINLLYILFYGNVLTITKFNLKTGNYENPETLENFVKKNNIELFFTYKHFEKTEFEPAYSEDRLCYFRNKDYSVCYEFIFEYELQKIRKLKLEKLMSL